MSTINMKGTVAMPGLNIKQKMREVQRGFTLLEVLLVVAVIAILAGIVIIAINPSKNLEDARDSQRKADVNTIINAVYQYALDQNGALPASIPTVAADEICKTGGTCTSLIDLGVLTTNGTYLVALPVDPACPTGCDGVNGTGYTIIKDNTTGRVTVNAPNANPDISVSR